MELARVQIWSDRGPYNNHTTPKSKPQPNGDFELNLGKVQLPQRYQQPPGRTLFLKPSSNSSLTIALMDDSQMVTNINMLRTII